MKGTKLILLARLGSFVFGIRSENNVINLGVKAMFNLKNDNVVDVVNHETNEVTPVRPTVLTQYKAHSSRSEKYSFISTGDVIEKFQSFGFTHKLIKEEKCRGHYAGYGTHLIALSHQDIQMKEFKNEVQPQLLLRNSYHGRTRILINLGMFRLVCKNGLMLGNSFQAISFKHIGITSSDVEQVLATMKDSYENKVAPLVSSLKSISMTEEEQMIFAQAALNKRLESLTKKVISTDAEALLMTRRIEDQGSSAWNVLQRVQENLGLNYRPSDVSVTYKIETKDKKENVVERSRRINRVSNIGYVTEMNQFLFDKIQGMYRISV